MSFVLDKVSEDTFYENLLLGLTKILERQPRFRNVTLQRYRACVKTEITSWEQFNGVKLPEDLKQFYLASNGFKLNWNYIFSNTEVLPVGSLNVNPICDLTVYDVKITQPPDLKGGKCDRYLKQSTETKTFKLASVDDENFVTLIYSTTKSTPNIFLIDENFYGYYLTNSFRKYLRMAIVHLGLPYWQFCFTPMGIPTWAEQIYIIAAPVLPTACPVPVDSDDSNEHSTIENPNYLDVAVFKLKPRERGRGFENHQLPIKNRKHSFKC